MARSARYPLVDDDIARCRRRLTAEELRAWQGHLNYAHRPLEAWPCDDLIRKIQSGETLSVIDGDMPQPDSDDSYTSFMRRRRYEPRSEVERSARRLTRQQREWEAQQLKIRQAAEAERKRLQEAEERKAEEARQAAQREAEAPVRAYWVSQSPRFTDEPIRWVRTNWQPFEFYVGAKVIEFEGGITYLVPESVADVLVGNHWAQAIKNG